MTKILSCIVALIKKLFGREDKNVNSAESIQSAIEEMQVPKDDVQATPSIPEAEIKRVKVGVYHNTLPHETMDNPFPSLGSEDREIIEIINTTDDTNWLNEAAFAHCPNVKYAYIGRNVYIIPGHCFDGDQKLERVGCKGFITRVDSCAFYNCTSLNELKMNCSELTIIKSSAFYNCKTLQRIDLSGCKAPLTIERYAFQNCTSLETVILPADAVVDETAFAGCEKVKIERV